ncbi:hypothetical protein SAMN05421784_10536 [Xenorhabdus koppenhoeferi]|uniref:Uncharacterized protein n=1 Tax=Xenorhabdus koppenhoeferi TaxID=351659 RepID=A0A1I7FRP1_9GAMM|nr:hypothetical protein SAMN05421784_10536 [Xenorhabdus koppenhoeferi]
MSPQCFPPVINIIEDGIAFIPVAFQLAALLAASRNPLIHWVYKKWLSIKQPLEFTFKN